MLLPLLPLRAVTLALTGWVAAAPGPGGDIARAEITTAATVEATSPVTMRIYDENHREYVTITLNRDGSTDPATATEIKRLFRCKRTGRQRMIDQGTLAMFAAVGAHYPGATIETISGYRAMLERDVRAIPDLRFEIQLLVAEPPRIAARLGFDCTPNGDFLGLPVQGRHVRFAENVFYEFRAGKIAQVWSVIDKAAIEAQLSGA